MRRFTDLLKRFRRDESGAFLVLFAVLALVLIATSGAVVDFTYMQTARSRAQNALDAAALALQAHITDSGAAATIKGQALQIMQERLNDTGITAQVNTVTIDTTAGKLNIQAQVTVPTAFIQLVGIKTITAQLTSEATKGSKNLEVSAALDTTGSMAGTKISDLISATNTLIDLVVQTVQTPTYSKMAIVPWSFAVNLGSTYANSVRGTPIAGVTISAASWIAASVTISDITKANPAVVTTATNHGLAAGDYIYISGVNNMTQVNNAIYKVGSVGSTTTFNLLYPNGSNVDSTGWSKFKTGGTPTLYKCYDSSCHVLITTTASHGLVAGDSVYIAGANVSAYNGVHPANVGTVPNSTTYFLNDETVSTVGFNSYTTNSGTSYCVKYGCTYYYFQNASTSWNAGYELWQANHCATERTTNAYTDTAPSTTYLGFNYTNNGSECITQVVQPLTTSRTTLHALANSLTAGGSTAGHLGLAWGWYMVSPNFGYIWPAASAPAAYSASNLVKAVILMTDGEFNVQYCNGVISADSLNGNDWDHINCNAPNGDSKTQATSLCAAIKAQTHTTLYTVGFDLGTDTAALTFLQSCASDPSDFFRADTGTDLTAAFKQIAQSLNSLRLSH